jgi:amino acid adenylation domain-containing protein/non-ribosomal peptide synthase protein (TIGR01720 family)
VTAEASNRARTAPVQAWPLAPAQRGMWIASRRDPSRDPYIVADISSVRGPLDVGALRQALDTVARKHVALRLSFPSAEELVQVASEAVVTHVETVDLRRHPEGRVEALRLAGQHALAPFDLAVPPLWRAAIFQLDAEEWILSLATHHLVCDEGSLAIVHQDLQAVYGAQPAGAPAPDGGADDDYLEYARRLSERSEAGPGERSLRYWSTVFADLPRDLDLRTDFDRSGPPSHRGHVATWALTPEEGRRFDSMAKELGATPFILMTTLFSIVLAQHCEQREFAVGAVLGTRVPGTVGHFANLLPIPVRLARDATLAEAVRSVRNGFLGTIDHQDVALDQIVAVVGGAQSHHRMPLCQAHVSWSEQTDTSWRLGSAIVEPVTRDSGSAKAELLLSGVRRGDRLALELVGEASLFTVETVRLLVAHVRALFRTLSSHGGEQRVFDAALADDDERERLLDWGSTGVRDEARTTIPQVFRAVARRHHDRTAVDAHDAVLTYAELDALSDRWARLLAEVGVTTDTVVGVATPRSAATLAIVLGTLKAGGAPMPLSHDGPAQYNLQCLDQCRATAVVTVPGEEATFRAFAGGVLGSDSLPVDPAVAVTGQGAPDTGGRFDSLALVCQTSGSTGSPKSVGLTHENILRVVLESSRLKHGPETTFVQLASPSFDISALEIWTCLLHGGRLVIPDAFRLDVPELMETLRSGNVTTYVTTTALFAQMVGHGLESLEGLEQIIVGGERAVPAVFDHACRTASERLEILHCYGPTENACISTSTPIVAAPGSTVPIGTPIEGSSAYVLDPISLDLLPVGIVGELFTGGQGVCRGYLNDTLRTAERLLPDPYSDVPGARMYRTGDTVRWTADGQLEFVGRVDRQVKIRGYRIEPGHVESVMLAQSHVRGAAVVARERPDGHRQLVAYVVTSHPSFDPHELRASVSGRLPDYMVPTSFVRVESLPLTSNGKIDYDALPAPSVDADADAPPTDEPLSSTELLVAECWRSVLGPIDIGRTDDFFAMGGDSILSIRVAAGLRSAGAEVVSADLYQAPTVASLAVLLDARAADVVDGAERAAPHPHAEIESGHMAPIGHWFLETFGAERHFNQSVRLVSEEPLDESLCIDAFGAVVAHHPMLRMSVRGGERGWMQEETKPVRELVEVVELWGSEDEREQALSVEARRLQRSIDLETGQLIGALFVPHESGRDGLLIVAHHWGVDTVSWDVIVRHFEIAYRQMQQGRTPELPTASRSVASWNAELTRHARSAAFANIAGRWHAIERARSTSALLPPDVAPGTVRTANTVVATLEVAGTEALLKGSRRECSADARAVLLTALARTLASRAGGSRWTIDMEAHGRDALGAGEDMSESVGWFTALHPLVLSIDVHAPVEEQLRSMVAELGRQPSGFTYGMSKYLRADWPRDVVPRSELVFNYQGRAGSGIPNLLRAVGGGYGGDIGDEVVRPYTLEVAATVRDGSLRIRLTYPGDAMKRSEMQLFVDEYVAQCVHMAQPFLTRGGTHA